MIQEISDVEKNIRAKEKELEQRKNNEIFDEAKNQLKIYLVFIIGAVVMVILGIALGVLISELNQNI